MIANEHWVDGKPCPLCGGVVDVTELDGWPYLHAKERGDPTTWYTCQGCDARKDNVRREWLTPEQRKAEVRAKVDRMLGKRETST